MGRESLGRRGVGALFLALLAAGCTRTLDLEVALTSPESPDPFVGVSTVRLSGVLRTGPVVVGEGRWDQGPLPFPGTLDARIRRLVVEGLDADGALVASGVSPPLDLLTDPPEGRLEILFTRVGALSRVGDGGAPRDGAGLEALGLPDGRVLFAGGRRPDGCPGPTEVRAERSRD
ncbi:MAG: hypothetical protein H6730_28755 [Deltaproteobacteria bacterium]|nr:hypothetical protein [Deltaproteobacteria bacterium]